jgi:hypothetical protein
MIRPILVLLFVFIFSSTLEAQGPWAKVPAFPTGCYTQSDPPDANIQAALDELQQEAWDQEAVNRDLRKQLSDLDQNAQGQPWWRTPPRCTGTV